jgi:hypothetical protein
VEEELRAVGSSPTTRTATRGGERASGRDFVLVFSISFVPVNASTKAHAPKGAPELKTAARVTAALLAFVVAAARATRDGRILRRIEVAPRRLGCKARPRPLSPRDRRAQNWVRLLLDDGAVKPGGYRSRQSICATNSIAPPDKVRGGDPKGTGGTCVPCSRLRGVSAAVVRRRLCRQTSGGRGPKPQKK